MPEINVRQAMVLEGATVLPNPRGTAPGLWLEARRAHRRSASRRAGELRAMFEKEVRPRLANVGARRAPLLARSAHHRLARIRSRAARFSRFTRMYPENGDHDSRGAPAIQLHPRVWSATPRKRKAARRNRERMALALGENLFSTQGESLEDIVGAHATENRATIAVAESCTGGMVAERLTNIPGSSAYFLGGVVCYSNDLKTMVGVPAELIESKGAVSAEVALALADGIRSEPGRRSESASPELPDPAAERPKNPWASFTSASPTRTAQGNIRFCFSAFAERIRLFASPKLHSMPCADIFFFRLQVPRRTIGEAKVFAALRGDLICRTKRAAQFKKPCGRFNHQMLSEQRPEPQIQSRSMDTSGGNARYLEIYRPRRRPVKSGGRKKHPFLPFSRRALSNVLFFASAGNELSRDRIVSRYRKRPRVMWCGVKGRLHRISHLLPPILKTAHLRLSASKQNEKAAGVGATHHPRSFQIARPSGQSSAGGPLSQATSRSPARRGRNGRQIITARLRATEFHLFRKLPENRPARNTRRVQTYSILGRRDPSLNHSYPVVLVIAYLLGSIPFGLLVVKIFRAAGTFARAGSGNIGAANVARTAGLAAGILTLLLDAGKGYLAVFTLRYGHRPRRHRPPTLDDGRWREQPSWATCFPAVAPASTAAKVWPQGSAFFS